MDKAFWIPVIIVVLLCILGGIWWEGITNKVDSAKTLDELREACSGFSVQGAPVRCLELGKESH